MRLGLFGGTFNPIHHGHLQIGKQVVRHLALDRLTLIPSGDPPHKTSTSLAPANHRLAMARLAVQGQAGFEVSDFEIQSPAKSYSINTVEHVRRTVGAEAAIYFIIGLDAFLEFPSWKDASRLLTLCHFAVVCRPGTSFHALTGLPELPAMAKSDLADLDHGTRDRVDVQTPWGTSIVLLNIDPCPISASDIRDRLRKGLPVSHLLPAPVESYIMIHGLYQEERHFPGR